MPISIEADPTLAQGYIKVNGTTAATVTSTGMTTASLQDNSVTTSKVNNAAITAAKLDGAQTGSAPIYGCRAWVNFDGTGTPAIKAAGNVLSITDNGTGDYTINFTTAMTDANYAVVASTNRSNTSNQTGVFTSTKTTSSVRIIVTGTVNSATLYDEPDISVAVFR